MAEGTPQERAEHDAQPPPGSPMRQDAPSPGASQGGGEPRRSPDYVPSDDDAAPAERPERDAQTENAETSLDQPSQ